MNDLNFTSRQTEELTGGKGATFTDLDGTLVRGNSLKVFMKNLPGMLRKRHAFAAYLSSLWWMWLRSVRLVEHTGMKWHLTKIAREHLLEEDWERMAEKMEKGINPHVREFIESPNRKDCEKYIATAAPEEYALPLCRRLGYDGVIATRFAESKSDYMEMRGSAKLDGIQSLLKERNLRLESFLTDHHDDLATAREFPELTILVNPTRKMQRIFQHDGVTRYMLERKKDPFWVSAWNRVHCMINK